MSNGKSLSNEESRRDSSLVATGETVGVEHKSAMANPEGVQQDDPTSIHLCNSQLQRTHALFTDRIIAHIKILSKSNRIR